MNVVKPYFRRVNDVKYCIITGIHGDKESHLCGALKTAVLTSQTLSKIRCGVGSRKMIGGSHKAHEDTIG